MQDEPMKLDEFLSVDENIDVDEEYAEKIDPAQQEIKLKEVGVLCQKFETYSNTVKELETKLNDAKMELDKIAKEDIPEALLAAGLTELKLESGKKITIQDDLYFSITDKNRADCMKWLRDNNFGDIIKNVVTATFAKGEDEQATEMYRELLAKGFNATHKEDVHWQTMKAFLKEQTKTANMSTADKDLFGVYEFKIAKIK